MLMYNQGYSSLSDLSSEKLEMLQALLAEEEISEHVSPVPTGISSTQTLPASYAQQRLWFLEHLDSQQPLYNLLAAFKLTGRLSLPTLQQSLSEIIRRQAILR